MEWIKLSISPVKDLITFLHQKSRTSDVHKKQLLVELRNNLNVFSNAFLNEVPYDILIEMLSNDAVQAAIKDNFNFKKLKPGFIEGHHILDERNKKYLGWDSEKLVDKIDEKIVELKNIKKMNGSLEKCRNNIPLMMSNLYFRMKLLADFIRSSDAAILMARQIQLSSEPNRVLITATREHAGDDEISANQQNIPIGSDLT